MIRSCLRDSLSGMQAGHLSDQNAISKTLPLNADKDVLSDSEKSGTGVFSSFSVVKGEILSNSALLLAHGGSLDVTDSKVRQQHHIRCGTAMQMWHCNIQAGRQADTNCSVLF